MGLYLNIFAKTKTAQDTSVNADAIQQQMLINKVETLLDTVNSGSQHVRNYYITFLLASFYIALIVWSTTDLMLLKDTPVTMPLLNVNLPITGFYAFAPYFFLILHFNLLLQFSLLADKIHRFDQAVIKLQETDSRQYYYSRLFAFAFTQILSARHHSAPLRFLLTLMVWITAFWLPLFILISLQVGFLPYHDENILFWQRIAVTLDLLILIIFWPIIRASDSQWRIWSKPIEFVRSLRIVVMHQSLTQSTAKPTNPDREDPLLESGIGALTVLCVTAFVWGIAVLPDSAHEQNVRDWLKASTSSVTWQSLCKSKETDEHYFIATEWLFDGRHEIKHNQSTTSQKDTKACAERTRSSILHRNLNLREKLLITNELKAEEERNIQADDEVRNNTALRKVTGLILSGRDLRYADFSEARLPKVDFVGANTKPSDLSHANFHGAVLAHARLHRVNFKRADLSKTMLHKADFYAANLEETNFQHANLKETNFREAFLRNANLQNADMYQSYLEKADLRRANLQNTQLSQTNLNDAFLSEAILRHTMLNGSKINRADLSFANLQGASLTNAKLEEADLSGAQLIGTDLRGATLHRSNLRNANLQAALLSETNMSQANLSYTKLEGADLTKANIEEANLSVTDFSLSDISDTQFGANSDYSTPIGKHVWTNKHTRIYSGWKDLHIISDRSDYQNQLASLLIELICQEPWSAKAIIFNRLTNYHNNNFILIDSAARCLLSLKDQENQSGHPICPALSKVDVKFINDLKRLEKTRPDSIYNNVIAQFDCRTKLSD